MGTTGRAGPVGLDRGRWPWPDRPKPGGCADSLDIYRFFTRAPLTLDDMIERMETLVATEKAESIVASAAADVGKMDIPAMLLSRIARQNAHLVELASNLIASGMDEVSIKSVIGEAMVSYEQELVQTIIALKKEAGHV